MLWRGLSTVKMFCVKELEPLGPNASRGVQYLMKYNYTPRPFCVTITHRVFYMEDIRQLRKAGKKKKAPLLFSLE